MNTFFYQSIENIFSQSRLSVYKKDRVDVILANPPFGASVSDGIETNYPKRNLVLGTQTPRRSKIILKN